MKPAYFIGSCEACAGRTRTPCTIIAPLKDGVNLRMVVKSFAFKSRRPHALVFIVTCLSCGDERRIMWEETGASIPEEALRCMEDNGFLRGIRLYSAFLRDATKSDALLPQVARKMHV